MTSRSTTQYQLFAVQKQRRVTSARDSNIEDMANCCVVYDTYLVALWERPTIAVKYVPVRCLRSEEEESLSFRCSKAVA